MSLLNTWNITFWFILSLMAWYLSLKFFWDSLVRLLLANTEEAIYKVEMQLRE